jgi:DNA segregation ATPase FtsK/SpoIIIE, S-DNA-T family
MLTTEQRREIGGIACLVVALFLALALIPLGLLGVGAVDRFPSGNLMGAVGRVLSDAVVWLLGPAPSIGVPLVVGVTGLGLAGWMDGNRAFRIGALLLGVTLLLPLLLFSLGPAPQVGGVLGRELGGFLVAAFGPLGSILVTLAGLIVLSVGTVGWNPLRPVARLAAAGGGAAARGAVSAGGTLVQKSGEALRDYRVRREQELAAAGQEEEGHLLPDPGEELDSGSPMAGEEPGAEGVVALPESARPRKGRPRAAASENGDLFADPMAPEELTGRSLPPLDLLTAPTGRDRRGMDRELDALGEVLVEKLRTFSVESTLAGRTTGPVVTQFEVVPAPGVKVNRIANLDADLALAMKARSIRIVAPIPGKGAVGVEIPNPKPETVLLREILESPAFQSSRADLPLALGRDLTGNAYVADLARMPHALIAGATGSGKSVCLNTVITSLVYRHTPETLRLLLIDPKMVELSIYADLPHLRHPVVTDPKEAAGVLKWAVLEMERRYALLSANGVRSLGEFNRRVRDGVVLRRSEVDGPDGEEGDPDRWIYQDGILPFIVLVVDELADLMMSVQGEVERPLTLLAQKARAIGIHIILATQRPSVNVITGLIKANFPCRIAFRVASKTDSRTILDQNGADALLGNGDMLFLPPGQGEPLRVQGAYIPTEDTDSLTGWFRDEAARRRASALEAGEVVVEREEEDILAVVRAMEAKEGGEDEDGAISGDWDELFKQAAEVCIQHEQGSTSLLQRRLKIGYGRAARIMDQLEAAGVLGAADGSKPREVMMSLDQLDRMMGGEE